MRRLSAVIGIAIVVLVSTGCLALDNTPVYPIMINDPAHNIEWADPSVVQFPGTNTASQVFTTEVGFARIPSWSEYSLNPPNQVAGSYHDALTGTCSWCKPFEYWAPDVIQVGGVNSNDYLMAFSAGYAPGAHCLGFAYSTGGPNGGFAIMPTRLCDPNEASYPDAGWFDPYLFDANGAVHMIWSVQQPQGPGNDSFIYEARLSYSPTSVSFASGPTNIGLGYGSAAAATGGSANGFNPCTGTGGNGAPCWSAIENPAVIADSYGGYDLIASVGTYNGGSYWTVHWRCSSFTSFATCTQPANVVLLNSGGATIEKPTGREVVWAAGSSPNRALFGQSSSFYSDS
ncbi:MAG TPA: hypothetical protein VIC86_09635 [Acidimicrobiales bacterium]|jgi:hypothetical protein